MSGQNWTPAPKKGIIPLHPLTFGMLLGKSFAALRHNPKVLFGFAVVIQLISVFAVTAVMGVVLFTSISRLETVSTSSPDYEAVLSGTIAINLVAGLFVGLASIVFTSIMQGVVAAEVGHAAVGVKATLRMLWRRMAPAFWRLVAFSTLAMLAVFGIIAIVAGIIWAAVAGGLGGTPELIGIIVLVVVLALLCAIPLAVWLSTKLLLVPSILVLEHATLRDAFVRSWRLTRGRFWVAFGVTFLISAIMGVAMQVVSFPVSILSTLLGSVIAPTGSTDTPAVIGYVLALLLPQVLLLVIQAISIVVSSTSSALIYLDCRMRYEGLDQTLISYVERQEIGWTSEQLGDPYAVDPARAVTSAPPVKATPVYAYPQPYPAYPYPTQAQPPAYPTQTQPQAYPGQAYPAAPPYGAPATPAAYPPPAAAPAPPAPPQQAPQAPAPQAAPTWTAPGSAEGDRPA